MKNLNSKALVVCFFALFALATSFTSKALIAVGEKVSVCHKGQVMLVSPNSVEGHLSHGDTHVDPEGGCNGQPPPQ